MKWVRHVCVYFIYLSVGVTPSLSVYIYWQLTAKEVILLTCIQWCLFSLSPFCQERMWTLITQILWHKWKFTSYPCQSNSELSLHSSPNSFLKSLFVTVCAVIGRSFVIQQIPSSNLFMVVVDNKCDCSMFEPITMDPIEIMYILHLPNTGEVGGGISTGQKFTYSSLIF